MRIRIVVSPVIAQTMFDIMACKFFIQREYGYNYCECGSILEYHVIKNPLYQNESITNNDNDDSLLPSPVDLRSDNAIEIKDEEIISKLQLSYLHR